MNKRGFTLIELIVTIAILAILTTLSIPAFSAISDSMRLQSDARQMAQVMRNARVESITAGKASNIYFYTYTGQYKDDVNGKMYDLREGISFVGTTTFSGTPPRCTFHPSGAASPAGTVTLKNKLGNSVKIVVSPVVGRVRIE